jgi:hypothetical protein
MVEWSFASTKLGTKSIIGVSTVMWPPWRLADLNLKDALLAIVGSGAEVVGK